MQNQTPSTDEDDAPHPLAGLPEWFTQREVIPLDDHLALIVCHETMHEIVAICRSVAAASGPVLLTGETGVGKSLLARFIHVSRNPYAPFASMTTTGLEATFLLQTIFEGGGSGMQKPALIEEASGGTLVLEEMGDLPHVVQQRLMQFWSEGSPRRTEEAMPDNPAQWICTTNLPRRALETPGVMIPGFLECFQRIHVPPLRERKQDIPAIVAYFSRLKSSREASLKSLEALAKRLKRHSFPGNVRELESIVALEAGGLAWEWRMNGYDRGASLKASRPAGPRRSR